MKRIHSPRGLRVLSVALVLLLGVFILAPAVTADDIGSKDEDGIYVGGQHGGGGGGSTQGSGSGGQGGDDTDPDWWTMSIWFQTQRSDPAESPVLRSIQVAGPFGGLISWLLREASSQYLSLWK